MLRIIPELYRRDWISNLESFPGNITSENAIAQDLRILFYNEWEFYTFSCYHPAISARCELIRQKLARPEDSITIHQQDMKFYRACEERHTTPNLLDYREDYIDALAGWIWAMLHPSPEEEIACRALKDEGHIYHPWQYEVSPPNDHVDGDEQTQLTEAEMSARSRLYKVTAYQYHIAEPWLQVAADEAVESSDEEMEAGDAARLASSVATWAENAAMTMAGGEPEAGAEVVAGGDKMPEDEAKTEDQETAGKATVAEDVEVTGGEVDAGSEAEVEEGVPAEEEEEEAAATDEEQSGPNKKRRLH